MKRKTKILFVILGVIVAALAALVIFQWSNIKALTFFLFNSEEKIAEMSAQNDKAISDAMSKIPDIIIRDLTEEERHMLGTGELSQEDAISLIVEIHGSSVTPSQGEPDSSDSQGRLAELLAGIYILRAEFSNSLESLKDSAIAEYRALPSGERGNTAKFNLAMKYLRLAGDLESECDVSIDTLLKGIEAELRAVGGDVSLASDIRSIYYNEKIIKKAEYMSLVNDL